MRMQELVRAIYPPQCLSCDRLVEQENALCPACWRETPFLAGLVCDRCGAPLPGEPEATIVHCDDCLRIARPWARGRAALLYDGKARDLILKLKHGDRLDLARPLGQWMARAAAPILQPDMVVAPVPLHWFRLIRRKANQAALLSARVAQLADLAHVPDLLQRVRPTGTQDGKGRDARFRNMADAIRPHPRRVAAAIGRHVLLIDDVMTSGATLAACADSLKAAGVAEVSILVLARVTQRT